MIDRMGQLDLCDDGLHCIADGNHGFIRRIGDFLGVLWVCFCGGRLFDGHLDPSRGDLLFLDVLVSLFLFGFRRCRWTFPVLTSI